MKKLYEVSRRGMERAFGLLLCLSLLIGVNTLSAQQKQVTGTVLDQSGPVAGVNVVVEGTTRGTTTDVSGKYSINAASTEILVFSFMGYETVKSPIANRNVIDVTLKEDAQSLDEIVVVGYGVQRKRDVTGSITSIRGDQLTAVPASNALQNLQGRVAGLDMSVSSGQLSPTSGLKFSVRGNRSLKASNDPLIMVDGIPYGTTLDINPSDIESIEVLRDASSTAIYGSRGANGVILVTTKRGNEGNVKISFNAYAGLNQLTGQMRVFSGEEYVAYKTEAYRAKGITEYEKIFSAPSEREYIEKGYFTNWGDLVIHNGSTQNYELNVSSGTKTSSMSFSLGLNDNKGLFKNEDQRRYNFRFAGDQQLFKGVKLGVTGNYFYKENNMRRDPTNIAYKIVPISRPYDDQGNFILYPAPGYTTQMSPIADEQQDVYVNNVVSQRFFATGYLDVQFIKNTLFFKSTFGIDSRMARQGIFFDYATIDGDNQRRVSRIGDKDNKIPNEVNYTWENTLNFMKTFGKHDISVLAGTSTIKNHSEWWQAEGKGQPDINSQFWYLQSNDREILINSSLEESSMVSFFGRANYKFNEKYILSASIRTDGSSVLAPGHKWAAFPSASLGWRINEENFLKSKRWLSDLKLRVSWGESGNSAISPYQTQSILEKKVYAYNEAPAYGYYPTNIQNPNLTWETTSTFNVGIDFSLWGGRLSGAVDYYNADTRDLLMESVIPGSSGYTSIWSNVGKTNNKGVEVSLASINTNPQSAVQWTTNVTFSNNKEKIVALASGIDRDEGNSWFVGQPTKVWFDYNKLGIWQLGEEAEAKKNDQLPGEIKVQTSNADGRVSTEDRMILGSPRPKFNFGMSNTVNYKNFDFTVFLYGKFGHMVASDVVGGFKPNALENCIKVDYWTPENPTNAYPRPITGLNAFKYNTTLRYIKGDFLKIRDITLGYTLPQSVNKRLGISRFRVYATATNFFTFCDSGFGDFDPERAINSTAPSFPLMRQLVFGINFNY